ncbi:MAG: hypothetical protein IJ945_03605 [Oscillospiraceae bacterium]|nr:hypothetical protein [Oscillospiraceae bacterium]
MKRIIAFLLVFILCFSGCGSDEPSVNPEQNNPESSSSPEISGEVFSAGNVKALVPEGWMAFTIADVFAETAGEKDPDVIQICKDAESDWDIFTNPYVQINYYGPDVEFFAPGKDWYTDTEDIKPFKAGSHEWEGFTGYSDEYLFAMLWCIEGDIEYQATMWLNGEDISINYNDDDVLAILASVAPAEGSVSSEEPSSPSEEPLSAEEAIYERYIGDWNGVLKIYDCTGDYASLENVVTGACARIVPDENGELFIFIGLYLEGFYITSAYYEVDFSTESLIISGDYNSGSYENVEILEHTPGTIGMTFPVIQPNGEFYFTINLRRIGDENWTNEDPAFTPADVDHFRGMSFEQIAEMMGYTPNQYPPAELFENAKDSSGSKSSVLGEKEGADGMVADYEALKTGLEWCKTERTYDSTYDEVAAQFGVHGFFVDEFGDKPYRRYRWFFDDSNYVTVTFEVKPDGTETWNVTAWEGIKD